MSSRQDLVFTLFLSLFLCVLSDPTVVQMPWELLSYGDAHIADAIGVWTGPDAYPEARDMMCMVYVPGTSLLFMMGGFTDALQRMGDNWLYDVETLKWTFVDIGGAQATQVGAVLGVVGATSFPGGRNQHSCQSLNDSSVLVYGGTGSSTVGTGKMLGDLWHFDVLTETYTYLPTSATPGSEAFDGLDYVAEGGPEGRDRAYTWVIPFEQNLFYVWGGYRSGILGGTAVFFYDIYGSTYWDTVETTNPPDPQYNGITWCHPTKRILYLFASNSVPRNLFYFLDLDARLWTMVTNPGFSASDHALPYPGYIMQIAAGTFYSGNIAIFRGGNALGGGAIAEMWLFDMDFNVSSPDPEEYGGWQLLQMVPADLSGPGTNLPTYTPGLEDPGGRYASGFAMFENETSGMLGIYVFGGMDIDSNCRADMFRTQLDATVGWQTCDGQNTFTNPSLVCSGHGACVLDGSASVCECRDDYGGAQCATPPGGVVLCNGTNSTDPGVCSGNGTCVGNDTCTCSDPLKYVGEWCEILVCNSIEEGQNGSCSDNGTCVAYNDCDCFDSMRYVGQWCEVPVCNGISGNVAGSCSDNGTCVAYDDCDCYDSMMYRGQWCDVPLCNGIPAGSAGSCSDNGTCVAWNDCDCSDYLKYRGQWCEVPVCNGIPQDQAGVCSDNGTCVAFDDCDCYDSFRYAGRWCETPVGIELYLPPSFELLYPQNPVGKCSGFSIDALDTVGQSFGVDYFWSSSHPLVNASINSTRSSSVFVAAEFIGAFTVTVYAVDFWDRESPHLTVDMTKSSLDLPEAQIVGPTVPTTFVGDTSFVLEGTFHLTCSSAADFVFLWEQNETVDGVVSPPVGFVVGSDAQVLRFPAGFPFDGPSFYAFRFTIVSENGNSSAVKTVRVLKRDLIALINQSSSVVSVGRTIGLSAGLSVDPEEDSDSTESSSYVWSCVLDGSTDCSGSLSSLTDVDLAVSVASEGEYEICVEFHKDTRNDTMCIVFVSVDSTGVPYAPLIWITPLIDRVLPSDRVRLVGHIEEHELALEVVFEWSCPSLGSLDGKNLTSLDSLTLVLKPWVFTDPSTECILSGTYETATSYASYDVLLNQPPHGGILQISPSSGVVLETFIVAFSDWIDEDFMMEYSLEMVHAVTNQTRLLQPFSPENVFPLTIASQGCRSNDYEVEVYGKVRDRYGSFVTVVPLNHLRVQPALYETVLDWVILMIGYLEEALDGGDPGLLLDQVLTTYNVLLKPNCTALSFQEKFCMSQEECEGVDVHVQNPTEFQAFQALSVEFLRFFLSLFRPSDVPAVSQIIGSVQLDPSQIPLCNRTLDLVRSVVPLHTGNINLEDWQYYVDAVSRSSEILLTSTDDVLLDYLFRSVDMVLSGFMSGLAANERSSDLLHDTDKLRFAFLKTESFQYVKSAKLRISEKVIEIPLLARVDIPSEVQILASTFFAPLSTRVIVFVDHPSEVFITFEGDNAPPSSGLVNPLKIAFLSVPSAQSLPDGMVYQCQESVEGVFVPCDRPEPVTLSDGSLECECAHLSTRYRVVSVLAENRMTEGAAPDAAWAVYASVFGVLGFLLLCVVLIIVAIAFVLVFRSRRRKKVHAMNPAAAAQDNPQDLKTRPVSEDAAEVSTSAGAPPKKTQEHAVVSKPKEVAHEHEASSGSSDSSDSDDRES